MITPRTVKDGDDCLLTLIHLKEGWGKVTRPDNFYRPSLGCGGTVLGLVLVDTRWRLQANFSIIISEFVILKIKI